MIWLDAVSALGAVANITMALTHGKRYKKWRAQFVPVALVRDIPGKGRTLITNFQELPPPDTLFYMRMPEPTKEAM